MTTPASAGPTARETLTLTRSSRDAARISARGTSSGTVDCHVGSWTATPAPRATVKVSSRTGGRWPVAARPASRRPVTKK